MEFVIAIAIVVGLVTLFVVAYALNQKQEIPESCRDLTDTTACGGCRTIHCPNHPKQSEEGGGGSDRK
jgi:hypothetical protein